MKLKSRFQKMAANHPVILALSLVSGICRRQHASGATRTRHHQVGGHERACHAGGGGTEEQPTDVPVE